MELVILTYIVQYAAEHCALTVRISVDAGVKNASIPYSIISDTIVACAGRTIRM
jgi:hypothetical protein